MLRTLVSACAFAVLAMSTVADAQPSDRRTFFTFSQPVSLPGVTLPAGTYLFRIADESGSRRVVHVLKADGSESYAMLMSIPAQRSDPPAVPEVRFLETATGTPAAIKTWWYPGSTIGYEFVYPKEQALRLARQASGVLTTASAQNETTKEMETADLSRVCPGGSETAVTVQQTPAATVMSGATQTGEIASTSMTIASAPPLVPAPSAAASPAGASPTRTALPQTASPMPLVGLAGALMLCAGLALARGPRLLG